MIWEGRTINQSLFVGRWLDQFLHHYWQSAQIRCHLFSILLCVRLAKFSMSFSQWTPNLEKDGFKQPSAGVLLSVVPKVWWAFGKVKLVHNQTVTPSYPESEIRVAPSWSGRDGHYALHADHSGRFGLCMRLWSGIAIVRSIAIVRFCLYMGQGQVHKQNCTVTGA